MAFDSATGNTFTCSSGGEVIGWTKAGVSKRVGKHTKPAERVVVSGGIAVSVGVDNVARFTDCSSLEMDGEVALEGGQPKSLAAAAEDAGLVLVGCTEGINVLRGIRKTQFLKFEKPTSIAVSDDGKSVAVGSEASSELSLYKVEGNTLVADGKIDGFSGKVTAVTFSPNGKFLAVADMSKDIKLYEASTRNLLISMFWQVHTSTVLHLKFSPDSSHLASCGVDSSVIIWDPAAKTKYTKTESGHVAGGITGLAWTSDKTIRTSGMDATVRSFDVTFL
jgi:WD40 repeat protein